MKINNCITVSNKNYKVYLRYIGEGYYGDFDEKNPDDEPLLRADIYTKCCDDKRRWNDEPITSSCTLISANLNAAEARKKAEEILEKVTSSNGTRFTLEYILSEVA